VRPRDTLAGIAYEEYGDPNRWRDIATTNEIDDPLGLRPGQILVIPPRG
jgi:nucleoid-associated protein YgaU